MDYFYELAKQIYASQRYLHDLLIAGDVTIVTIARNHFDEQPLDPVTAKQVKNTEIINKMLALLANYYNVQKYELPHYEHTSCFDCLTTADKFKKEPFSCRYSKYYDIDGHCLNPKLPGSGAVYREFRRLAQPFCTLHNEHTYCEMPGVRKVSLAVKYTKATREEPLYKETSDHGSLVPNVFVLNLAQNNIHDIVHPRYQSNSQGHLGHAGCSVDQRTRLNSVILATAVAPISVDCTDPFYSQFNVTCLNFVRGQTLNEDCQLRHAGILNQNTIVDDLDQVYVRTTSHGREFLNADNGDHLFTEHGLPVVGDERSTQHLGLYSILYFYSKLHNLIAEDLRRKCHKLEGYEVFQKARALNIALHQRYFYDEVVAAFIGSDAVKEHQLSSEFDTFDEFQEAEILSEYACAAGRAAHNFVPDEMKLFDRHGKEESTRKYRETFSFDRDNEKLVRQVGFSTVLQPWKVDGYSDEVGNYLFYDSHLCYGTDLLSLDLQRGRDCCLKPYVHYLKLFFDKCVRDWDDLREFMCEKNIRVLQQHYKSVQDVDLMAGGEMEDRHGTSLYGKTFTKIVGEQRRRLKNGNSKWWTRIYSKKQQEELKNPTLADLVGLVFGYDKVPKNALFSLSKENPLVSCRAKRLSDVFDVKLFCDFEKL
ncbi:chorion peroxidase-like [Culicoides brevitarsis]|uniref:chorion peroxidase-like n=1 Tax=Culicoides brevitarsis TaxID=469753 RepID=UPI00307CB17D